MTGKPAKFFHGVGIGPLSKILAVNEGRPKLEIQISNEKLYNFLVTTVITSVL